MTDCKCNTCIWWDDKHPRLQYAPKVAGIESSGFCRKHKPGVYTKTNTDREAFAIGIQPITDRDDGCAEYKGEK